MARRPTIFFVGQHVREISRSHAISDALFAHMVAFESHLVARLTRPQLPLRMSASTPPLPLDLPFVIDAERVAEDVNFRAFGVTLNGRAEYVRSQELWQQQLSERLRKFEISDKTILPPDRGTVIGRYRVSFEAPVPPQYMPEQRARLARANLTTTEDGYAPVEALIACTIELDRDGRVRRHVEQLAVDPFAVTATIAHFEYVFARQMAVRRDDGLLAVPTSYWLSLRELTRRELNEVVVQSRRGTDLSALQGGQADAEVSDEEFERWFAVYLGRNFLAGGAIGAVAYGLVRALKEGADLLG